MRLGSILVHSVVRAWEHARDKAQKCGIGKENACPCIKKESSLRSFSGTPQITVVTVLKFAKTKGRFEWVRYNYWCVWKQVPHYKQNYISYSVLVTAYNKWLSVLRSDWLSYWRTISITISNSRRVAKNAGFQSKNNGGWFVFQYWKRKKKYQLNLTN